MSNTISPLRLAIGDLGPARRHIERLLTGQLPASAGVLGEIKAAQERCVTRLEALEAEALAARQAKTEKA